MEYKELIDAFAAKCGLEQPDAKDGVELSEDGKTATVTVSIDKDISTNGSKLNEYKIGTAKITQKTMIDLTKPMPEVVDVTFSQVFSPDKIRHNPNVEAVL